VEAVIGTEINKC